MKNIPRNRDIRTRKRKQKGHKLMFPRMRVRGERERY